MGKTNFAGRFVGEAFMPPGYMAVAATLTGEIKFPSQCTINGNMMWMQVKNKGKLFEE